MPLKGTYSWQDKRDSLKVSIPLKGVSPSAVDIFVTESTLKVNYQPYIIDIVLANKINPIRHKATVKDGSLIITLLKKDQTQKWEAFESDVTDRSAVSSIKTESISNQALLEIDLKSKRKDKKIEDERFSLRKSMNLTTEERERLESMKEEEKLEAEKEVYETFAKLKQQEEENLKQQQNVPPRPIPASSTSKSSEKSTGSVKFKIIEDMDDSHEGSDSLLLTSSHSKEGGENPHVTPPIDWDAIDDYSDNDDDDDETKEKKKENAEEEEDQNDDDHEIDIVTDNSSLNVKYIPPPRSQGISQDSSMTVNIVYTPRVFPTPMRESKQQEEDDWVAKNRRHLKKHGILGKNLTRGNGVNITEEDPIWLKGKGDDFYRVGDYLSAIHAYSSALDLDDSILSCYSNRSICYLKMNFFNDCLLDCDMIINKIEKDEKEYYFSTMTSTSSTSTTYSSSSASSSSSLINNNNNNNDDSSMMDLSWMIQGGGGLPIQTREVYKKALIRRSTIQCSQGNFILSLHDLKKLDCLLNLEILEEKKMMKLVEDMTTNVNISSSSSSGGGIGGGVGGVGGKKKQMLMMDSSGNINNPPSSMTSTTTTPYSSTSTTFGEAEFTETYRKLLNMQISIQQDMKNIQLLIQIDHYKQQGDMAFGKEKDLLKALNLYSEGLLLFPGAVNCLSNRAACYFGLKEYDKCINDCSLALDLMQLPLSPFTSSSSTTPSSSTTTTSSINQMLASFLPTPGTEKRKNWILKTLLRRAVSYGMIEQYESAIHDYEEAMLVDPTNQEILKDLNHFKQLLLLSTTSTSSTSSSSLVGDNISNHEEK